MKFNEQTEIVASSNGGYLVKCGCATMTYTDKADLTSDILEFLKNPDQVRKEYNSAMDNSPAIIGGPSGSTSI